MKFDKIKGKFFSIAQVKTKLTTKHIASVKEHFDTLDKPVLKEEIWNIIDTEDGRTDYNKKVIARFLVTNYDTLLMEMQKENLPERKN